MSVMKSSTRRRDNIHNFWDFSALRKVVDGDFRGVFKRESEIFAEGFPICIAWGE